MGMPQHIIKIISDTAATVHKKVRIATIEALPRREDADAREQVFSMLGAQAGLLSAVVSNVADLHECEMIDDEAFERLNEKAMDICKDVQIELQKQIARDLHAAGADIDLSKLETAHEDAKTISTIEKEKLH